MANPILPDSGLGVRTHPFQSPVSGDILRVVEAEDGQCHLETAGGTFLEFSSITGPEILKLSSQGRALWNALSQLVAVIPPVGLGSEWDEVASARAVAAVILEDTAATFDLNEPEERPYSREAVEPGEVDRGDD